MARTNTTLGHTFKIFGIILAICAVAAAAVYSLFLSMDVHIENGDLTPPTPTAEEKQRQQLAIQAQRIAHSSALTSIGNELSTTAQSWVDTLGGVWIPWPQGAPEGYSNPAINTASYNTFEELRGAVAQFATDALAFSEKEQTSSTTTHNVTRTTQSDATNASYASIAALAVDATYLGVALDLEAGISPACEPATNAAFNEALARTPSALTSLDAARQWLEYRQAFLEPEAQAPYAQGASILHSIVGSALDAGVRDTRPVMAPPPTDGDDAGEVVHQALAQIASHATTTQERAATISVACVAASSIPQ